MYEAKVYQVMVGAPGDIDEEVGIVRRYIEQWNGNHSCKQEVVLLSRYWDRDCFPEAGERAQAVINRQLTDGSDMLVCILNARMGDPTGGFVSGTAEEIEEHLREGKPVMTYFRNSADNLDRLDFEQLKQLREFKAMLKKRTIYRDYRDAADFDRCFYSDLEKAVNKYFIPDRRSVRSAAVGQARPAGRKAPLLPRPRPAERKKEVPARRTPRPRTRLRVVLPGNRIIEERYARDTMAGALRYAGPARVAALGMLCCGIPLVGTELDGRYGAAQVPVGNGYYAMTHSSTLQKKRLLERVFRQLGVDAGVEVVSD